MFILRGFWFLSSVLGIVFLLVIPVAIFGPKALWMIALVFLAIVTVGFVFGYVSARRSGRRV